MGFKSIIGTVCACLVVVSFNANGVTYLDQEFTLGDGDSLSTGAFLGDKKRGQSFTMGGSGQLLSMDFLLKSVYVPPYGTPQVDIYFTLYAVDNNFEIIADQPIASGQRPGGSFTEFEWVSFNLEPFNIIAERGDMFAMGLGTSTDGFVDIGRPAWQTYDYGHSYEDWGVGYWSQPRTTRDWAFRTYIDSVSPPEPLPPISGVPIPAAVWLFGSGLIGLVGLARRKKS